METAAGHRRKQLKAKIRQFIDYYLVQTIIILLCVGIVAYFIKTIAFDRKDVVLSVMILNDNENLDIDLMEAELKDYLGIVSEKQDITFSFLKTDVAQNEAIILTRLRAKSVDIIISDKKTFQKYASNGIYAELDDLLDEVLIQQNQDKLLQGKVSVLDGEGKVISEETEKNFGWNLAENKKYVTLGGIMKDAVLGIVINSMNCENAVKAIEYFMEQG